MIFPINEILFLPPAFQLTKELCVPLKEYKDFNFHTDKVSRLEESDFWATAQKMLNRKRMPINDVIL